MRYIRQQVVTTTISNEELTSKDIILSLCKKIQESSVDVSIEYRDKKTDSVKSYAKARVTSVKDNSLSIRAFFGKSNITIEDIDFESIITLKLVTAKHNIVSGNQEMSKFDFLDIE